MLSLLFCSAWRHVNHSMHRIFSYLNGCSYSLNSTASDDLHSDSNQPTGFSPVSFLFFNVPLFISLSLIATSSHPSLSLCPSILPLSSHLLSDTPQLSPSPLTVSLSRFPFNTCHLLPVRLSRKHHKKVTPLFSIPLLLVLVLLDGDGNFN